MIELTTSVLLLVGTFYGGVGGAPTGHIGQSNPIPLKRSLADRPVTLEEYVREYFKETPIMAEIAKCESRFRHLGRNGKVLRGELTPDDLGVMQVNEFYHEDTAKALEIDLHTLDGNLAYAKWLYQKEGTRPWYSSSKCWQKSDTIAKATEIRLATN